MANAFQNLTNVGILKLCDIASTWENRNAGCVQARVKTTYPFFPGCTDTLVVFHLMEKIQHLYFFLMRVNLAQYPLGFYVMNGELVHMTLEIL